MKAQETGQRVCLTLDAIVGDYGKLVSAICHRMITDEDRARDAAQQVWVEIVKSFPSFRGDSKVSTWIYTISRRIAMDYAKSERRISTKFLNLYSLKEELDFPSEQDLDKRIWAKQMCDKCVTGILHCVDNESRLAHILRDIAELEYEEIAQIMEMDPTAIRQVVTRSRRKISAFLNERCTLYNPDGDCRCRMSRCLREVDLVSEYQKIGAIVRRVNFFKRVERTLPRKSYWESHL